MTEKYLTKMVGKEVTDERLEQENLDGLADRQWVKNCGQLVCRQTRKEADAHLQTMKLVGKMMV